MQIDQRWNVVYMEAVPEETAAVIASCCPADLSLCFVDDYSDEAARRALQDADFAIVATHSMPVELIEAAPKLKLIQHQGVGYDRTDVVAAARRGIPVALCPAGTIVGVAEHTILLILAVYKQLAVADASVRAGKWLQFGLRAGSFELAGKTLGLVGFGRIGEAVAVRADAFGASVCYFDPIRRSTQDETLLGVRYLSLDDLFATSDIVSLHLPSTPDTVHLVDAAALDKMKPGCVLINTARGNLVDQAALTAALQAGQIAGAGLDVFETEPPEPHDPLLAMPNVVFTPHIAAGTRDALVAKMDACFANIERVMAGELPDNIVIVEGREEQ